MVAIVRHAGDTDYTTLNRLSDGMQIESDSLTPGVMPETWRATMTLQERLDELKAKAKQRVPPENWEVMQRATATLVASGITHGVVKVGEKAPDFTLPTRTGQMVALGSLLPRGPVVLSFYRGRW